MSSSKRQRILIAEDMAAFRSAYASLIREKMAEDFELCGEATNGAELIALHNRLKPDVLLVDLIMPLITGIEAIKEIRKTDTAVKIIVLTTVQERTVIENIYPLIDSYLFKETENIDDILEVIRYTVFYSSPSFRPYIRELLKTNADTEEISFREFELMIYIRKGMLNKEIAAMMFVSEKTVEKQLSKLFKKLGISNRKELEMAMIERGLRYTDTSK